MKIRPLMVKHLTIALFAIVPMVQAAPVSFNDAWHTVVTQNDGLAADRASVEQAQYMQDAAKDLYFPKVTVGANYTRLDHDIKLSPADVFSSTSASNTDIGKVINNIISNSQLNSALTSNISDRDVFTSSIRAIWPIFTGGRINAAQDIAQGKTDQAKYMLAMQQQAKFEDLSRFYFGVVLAKNVLQTRTEVATGLKHHYQDAVKLEQQGQIARVERLQAQAAYDKAKVEQQKSLRDLEIAQVALTQLLKQSTPAMPSTGLFINNSLPPMSAFVDKTLATYPGLHILDAKRKQAGGLIEVEQGKYYPEVYLYGDYNLHDSGSLAAKMAPDWAVGVGVSVPLIDNSGRSGKLSAAHSMVTQVNHLQAQAQQDLTVLVEKTYREAKQALEEYNGLASSLALANENSLLREKAFGQGLSTSLDVVDAELFVASIKTQRLAAAYQYVACLTRLLAISGEMNTFKNYQQYQGIEVKL
ncbi:TolC family protein [Photobacterium carnosum]|uniref:TolC family protein n=1 Tax=Photobacterium carnosum TaxID=2023717 RepID=UPI001E3B3BF3|nr:TolC family protein [Photobacterium carnosum]MCD9498178.1 TolC family protein [Photobacterium carnosum]MCD9516109.1 TolC family protein [Photobacterium carnosum]MCD9531176.1 TolC family protein [Photobacterium carnosum]MCD9539824.1 TolC family protein [Photobacterium carnosum]MCF2153366.1 TolC family protein [Photobacterium carnosum]